MGDRQCIRHPRQVPVHPSLPYQISHANVAGDQVSSGLVVDFVYLVLAWPILSTGQICMDIHPSQLRGTQHEQH
jgi:hypothetical protein